MAKAFTVLVGMGDQVRPQHIARMEAAAPDARIIQEVDRDRQLALAPETQVYVGGPGPEFIERAGHLEWIQLGSAGVEGYAANPRLREQKVLLTNASGVFGVCIAEHVFGLMLAFSRGIQSSIRSQALHEWARPNGIMELAGRTLLVLGLGDIGREVAIRARAFGMRVLALKRQPGPKQPEVDEIYGPESLDTLLPQADVVVISLPLTQHTRGWLDERRLKLLPKGAILINIGRGAIVDEDALIGVLRDGHLAGAGLDVFATEPLPASSPLWELPNVIITPHVSGRTPRYRERFCDIVCQNLSRYVAGEPMRNVVDWEQGY